jgi:chemotaxis protein MotB
VEEDEAPDESWLITYADAITLLMAFFVMLLNFSKIDIPSFEKTAAGIKNEIGMGKKEFSPISILEANIKDVVTEMQADKVVKTYTDDNGIVIELASSAFYKPGSAKIRKEAKPVLRQIAGFLSSDDYLYYNIDVEGHTDDDPIHTLKFPSNWELAADRATEIVHFFINMGFDPERMMATSFADTRPKVPNRDKNGNPIPKNQAKNRRVMLRVYPMSLLERARLDRKYERIKKIEQAKRAQKAGKTGGGGPGGSGQNQGAGTAPKINPAKKAPGN